MGRTLAHPGLFGPFRAVSPQRTAFRGLPPTAIQVETLRVSGCRRAACKKVRCARSRLGQEETLAETTGDTLEFTQLGAVATGERNPFFNFSELIARNVHSCSDKAPAIEEVGRIPHEHLGSLDSMP
jgi:hypothetical protein